MRGNWLIAVGSGLCGVMVGMVVAQVRIAHAQPSGIDFVVPDGTPISAASSSSTGDTVIFTGQAAGLMAIGTCSGNGNGYPIQDATVIDPNTGSGARATRLTGIINASSTTPVKPGTRLNNLVSQGSCVNGAFTYNKYHGDVL